MAAATSNDAIKPVHACYNRANFAHQSHPYDKLSKPHNNELQHHAWYWFSKDMSITADLQTMHSACKTFEFRYALRGCCSGSRSHEEPRHEEQHDPTLKV